MMSRCIRDDAELESILSILNRNKVNKPYVTYARIVPIADLKTVKDAAAKLGIPPGTTGVLDHENVDALLGFIRILEQKDFEPGSVIVEQLTKMFGVRQVALLVYRIKWRWNSLFTTLKAQLFDHLVKEGTTPDILHDQIMEARLGRAKRARKGGHNLDAFERKWENALLTDYRAHFKAIRKRKRANDTSAGPS